MSKHFFVINIVIAIVDTIICGIAVVGFCIGAIYFEKWWILLFNALPLFLFMGHTIVCDADVEGGEENDS